MPIPRNVEIVYQTTSKMKNKKRRVLVTFKVMIDYLVKNKSKLPKNIDFDFIRIPQALNSNDL